MTFSPKHSVRRMPPRISAKNFDILLEMKFFYGVRVGVVCISANAPIATDQPKMQHNLFASKKMYSVVPLILSILKNVI